MKKLALLAIFGLLTLGSSAQKFGHINYQELISLMPERTSMQTTLQDELNGLESHLMSMQTEYQSMVEEFKNNEESYDELTKQDKISEIQGLEQRLTTFQQSAQASLQEKEQELLQPILEKAQNAIDVVAEKGKYTYILDSSSGFILYSKDSEDILEKVKLALKI
ncbi:MAG: OmpH family outer membrane protein [Flavobacteriales bacterium]|nr:OmpH family outer membrane protein [Flavobacteriales bacterium]MBT5699129.1 OmpH family outer membrane protein [Flavobacteriales bacterium]MBT6699372.1 OmpH family outer membrane protein [Flavobacteriales bacterium]MBT6814776.1 OmpH family outer membrane protein [Flavobacteriales bacterium]MBT7725786.1 OmpH family outer membrane protein [Flavobacteriales bacterium]